MGISPSPIALGQQGTPVWVRIVRKAARENELAIFPNPNKGEFTLELSGEDYGQVEVRIYDISGTLVYHQTGI